MKYIRIKDQIGELLFIDDAYCIKEKNDNDKISIYLDIENPDDYPQADTIEELCDEIVIYDKEQNKGLPISSNNVIDNYKEAKSLILACIKAGLDVWLKLAIWTDKGLIYVAKMNDKGELELI